MPGFEPIHRKQPPPTFPIPVSLSQKDGSDSIAPRQKALGRASQEFIVRKTPSVKHLIIPVLILSLLVSQLIGLRFWGEVFNRIIAALDLSPSQAWAVSPLIHLVAILLALSQVVTYAVALRRREPIPVCRHVGMTLCLCLACLLIVVSGLMYLTARNGALTGPARQAEAAQSQLLHAGRVSNGLYSNRLAGIAVKVPDDWPAASPNALLRSTTGAGPSPFQGLPGCFPLFRFERLDPQSRQVRSTFSLVAFDKAVIAALGLRNLEEYAASLARTPGPSVALQSPSRQRIGTEDGYHIHMEGWTGQTTFQQHLYVLESDHLYLWLIAAGSDVADLKLLQEAVMTVHR